MLERDLGLPISEAIAKALLEDKSYVRSHHHTAKITRASREWLRRSRARGPHDPL